MTTLSNRLVPRTSLSRPHSLLHDFDRLFGATWPAPATRSATPRIDVHESDEAWTIDAELPGLEQSDIEVSFDEGVLTISGERNRTSDDEDEATGARHVERYQGSFRRSLRLPEDVDGGAIKAAYKNGVLSVTVPKPPKVEPEVLQIPVTVD